MSAILNLKEHAITIIAESEYKTLIDPSGYVARVEYDRRKVGYAPIGGQRVAKAIGTPIIEENPMDIVIEDMRRGDGFMVPLCEDVLSEGGIANDALLLVSREVAEAAARGHKCYDLCGLRVREEGDNFKWGCSQSGKPHHLASRMVYVSRKDRVINDSSGVFSCGYRTLQRVPQ